MSTDNKLESSQQDIVASETKEDHVDPAFDPTIELKVAPGAQVKQVANAELFSALRETNIPKWSKQSVHLYLMIFTAFCCAIANGYDGSLMTAILAMPYFQQTFTGPGVDTGPKVSVIYSLYTVGAMVGAPFAAVLADRYGRRKGMFGGAAVILVGMAITASSSTIAQLVVGRFVLGWGIAIATVAAPAYSIEVAPPHWRGRCTGLYNCGYFGGSIPAAAICFGTNYINNNLSWRLPLIFQAFACVLVMVLVFFIPESPRFLMAQGREDEAREFLVTYHGNMDPNSALVHLEIEEMREGIKLDGIDKRWWDYRPLFLSHGGRWRMTQVLMISIFGQFSGNGLGYFNTVIYQNLGISSVARQLGYNLASSVVSAFSAVSGAALTDRMPRRKVLVFGTFACAVLLGINSGLSAELAKEQANNDIKSSVSQGALAAYFLFNCMFSFTYTPLQGVIPAEALETTMRAKGLALSGIIVNAIGFINQFAGPIALHNIKYKYIYIFVGWDVCESVLWYIFCVESQGRTLEELEWVYEQRNPVRASLKVEKVVLEASGGVAGTLAA